MCRAYNVDFYKDTIYLMLRIIVFLSGIILSLLFFSCGNSLLKSEHLEIVVEGESFSIEWDDDSLKISHNVYQTVKFRLYYREHGSSLWRILDEVEAKNNPSYTISKNKLDFGIYDLGVSSVDASGSESEIHSSLDMSAVPFCGWYINWIGLK